MKVITLCGSTKFKKEFEEINKKTNFRRKYCFIAWCIQSY